MRERGEYVLPVRLDDTELDGLLPTVQYLEAAREGIDGIVAGILHKIGTKASSLEVPGYHGRLASSPEELQQLISSKTPGWEYVLYGSVMRIRRDQLANAKRDHSIGFAPPNEFRVRTSADAVEFASAAMEDIARAADLFNTVLEPAAFAAALGEPGVEGDADGIIHLATRFMDCYERFIQIASRLRGASVDMRFRPLIEATAKITDKPLADLDGFLDTLFPLLDGIAERLRAGETIEMRLEVELTLDNQAMSNFSTEVSRAAHQS